MARWCREPARHHALHRRVVGHRIREPARRARANAGWAWERIYRTFAPGVLGFLRVREVVRLCNAGAFAGRRAGGLGLALVERRLALAYAGRARFNVAAAGAGTVAEVAFPPAGSEQEERA